MELLYRMIGNTPVKVLLFLWCASTLLVTVSRCEVIEEYACFNTVFEIECSEDETIVFETARYGRNDTGIATRCQVPYQRNCDVDVHFPLNRVCAGKDRCRLAVNTALFGDPCGYEEFLKVTYRCVPVRTIHRTCFGPNGPGMYDSGYISSPNYPNKYYMDAECQWRISVQKRQTVKITIFDFELDVKKSAKCTDYLEISSGNRVYFKDCGSLGKQIIEVDSNKALVKFKTGETSLTQRGFFIFFEAIGPGCPDLEDLTHGAVDYFIDGDVLYANATCDEGFVFSGTQVSYRQIQCASGSYWSSLLVPCIAPVPTTPVPATTTNKKQSTQSVVDRSGSLVGIALGVVSAILLITLLLVLALYFHRRRRNAERKLDQWRVVINNLQESAMNEENTKRQDLEDNHHNLSPSCNIRKAKRKNKKTKNNREDEWQGRNLLASHGFEDEDLADYIDQREMDTVMKYAEMDECRCGSRRNSVRGGSKYVLTKSRDSHLDGPSIWADEKQRSRRDMRHKRTRSGQWESTKMCNTPAAVSALAADKKLLTQSAPDLLEMVQLSLAGSGRVEEAPYVVARPPVPNNQSYPSYIGRSSTLGAVHHVQPNVMHVQPNVTHAQQQQQKYVRPPVPVRTSSNRAKVQQQQPRC